jgi:hypothetical protein
MATPCHTSISEKELQEKDARRIEDVIEKRRRGGEEDNLLDP